MYKNTSINYINPYLLLFYKKILDFYSRNMYTNKQISLESELLLLFYDKIRKGVLLMNKKLLSLVGAGLLAVSALIAGCGGQSANDDKVLKVATTADFAPFEFQGEQDGQEQYQGFDMDLIRAIGKEMGMKVEIQNSSFDGLIPSLETNKVDAVISGMSINPEREAKVSFSDPYYTSGLTIIVNKDNNTIHGLKDLEGKRIAVQIGTTGATEAAKIKDAKLSVLDVSSNTFLELKAGNVDAVINDRPVNDYYIATTKDDTVKQVGPVLSSEQYGIAMKKGNTELVKKVNEALKKLHENGEYNKIYEKWFGKTPENPQN